jgi:hypothetical protein
MALVARSTAAPLKMLTLVAILAGPILVTTIATILALISEMGSRL